MSAREVEGSFCRCSPVLPAQRALAEAFSLIISRFVPIKKYWNICYLFILDRSMWSQRRPPAVPWFLVCNSLLSTHEVRHQRGVRNWEPKKKKKKLFHYRVCGVKGGKKIEKEICVSYSAATWQMWGPGIKKLALSEIFRRLVTKKKTPNTRRHRGSVLEPCVCLFLLFTFPFQFRLPPADFGAHLNRKLLQMDVESMQRARLQQQLCFLFSSILDVLRYIWKKKKK